MARGALKEPPLVKTFRCVLSADGIIRAELRQFQGSSNGPCDPPPDLDQSAQRSLGVGTAGVQQYAVSDLWQRVDSLADGTGRISAFQRYGRNQQMRERVQQN